MKYLRSFYKRHRGMAALALLLLLGQVVGTLLIPALIANVVDLGILPGDMDAILRTGGQMLAVALLSGGGGRPPGGGGPPPGGGGGRRRELGDRRPGRPLWL